MKHLTSLVGLVAATLLTACTSTQNEQTSPDAILFTNVHVVDVANGTLLEHRQVLVDSGRILQIGDSEDHLPAAARVVDGQGGYLIPGLTEMHAHIPPPTDPQWVQDALFLYLSQGVTTIRGMLGHPQHLQLRVDTEAGRVTGPRIFTSSPSLNGNTVPDPRTADSLVRTYAADGYDFLKIHPGIPLEAFNALVATAKETGIPFAGHVPVAVGIRHALESGYATVDHVDGYLEGLVPPEAGLAPDANGFFGFNFTDRADTTYLGELLQATLEHDVWVVPTQSLFERWFAPTTADSLLAQPEMQYMPQAIRDQWRRSKTQYMADANWNAERWVRFNALRLELIRRLHEEGQGLLLGSDAPQIFNVPGFSIYHEVIGMRNAGLPMSDILKMGTLDPARFFGLENEIGSIQAGKKAEFVLLAENPLIHPEALRAIRGVMRQGTWHDAEALEAGLQAIADRYSQNSP